MNRTGRLLKLAIARRDLAAITILRARIASVPWLPEPEYVIFRGRLA